MQIKKLDLIDPLRARNIPICIYAPKNMNNWMNVVIFNACYQGPIDRAKPGGLTSYKNYHYLAEFFISKNYVFITIQHEVLDDNDGLETLDQNQPQLIVRKFLWERGQQNIFFGVCNIILCKLQNKK